MDINQKSINNIRAIVAQTISNANSGHTGSAISAVPMLYALFNDHLKFNPKDTAFPSRDRFVMSAGHASGLLYSLLHLYGYNIKMSDLKNFRKYGSKTPGHPEYNVVPGVETTTGPLGQGVANAVGMAIAETMFASNFNKEDIALFDNYTYCYAGDGCLMEGVAVEACSLAGTLCLNKLILLYEDNNTTIDGTREIANNENTAKKFEAMGWNTIVVENGNNYSACTKAIEIAKHALKPTIIIFKTTIGFGTSLEGTSKIHAHPLSSEELAKYLNKLEITQPFYIEQSVYDNAASVIEKNLQKYAKYCENVKKYSEKYANDFKLLKKYNSKKSINYQKLLECLLNSNAKTGRDFSGVTLKELSKEIINLVGGAADLVASTKASVDGEFYSKQNRNARNIHFGIREHAMGAIANGIALYQNQFVFDSTFTIFSNYMLPAIRMRSMMSLPVISILTHDSINIGQDGPTHQPIESLTILRSIPNYAVFRPATPAEVVASYKTFFETKKPTAIVLTKSNLLFSSNSTIEKAETGGYIIYENSNKPQIEIFATGTEVELAIKVAEEFSKVGARVISMPCESVFEKQNRDYKNSVLLEKPKLKVAIEASNDNVWYKYIGENGLLINVSTYQFSGDGNEVYEKAGFNKTDIINKINSKLKTL